MPDVIIRFVASADGVKSTADEVNDSVGEIGNSAGAAANKFADFASGLVNTSAQMANLGLDVASTIGNFVQMGEQVQLTTQGLNAMSGGQADQYLDRMRASTHGLVDDMELAHDATLALSTGVVSTAKDMSRLAADGTALGRVFQGDASTGIQSLIRDLEMVGSTRGLKQLGLDATEVKDRFQELQDQGVPAAQAWQRAVMESADKVKAKLGDTMDTAGSSVDKFKVQWTNAFDGMGSIAAGTFEAGLVGANNLTSGIHGVVDALTSGNAEIAIWNNLKLFGGTVERTDFKINPEDYGMGGPRAHDYAGGRDWQQTMIGNGDDSDTSNTIATLRSRVKTAQSDINSGVVNNANDGVSGGPTTADLEATRMAGDGMLRTSDEVRQNAEKTTAAFSGTARATRDAALDAENLAAASAKAAAAAQAEAEARKSMTAAEILGAKSNTLASDIASGADGSTSAARDAYEKQLQAKVGHYDANGSGWAGGQSTAVDDLNPKLAKAKAHYDDLAYSIAHTKHETESQALAFSEAAAALTKLQGANAASGGSTGPYKTFTKGDEASQLAQYDRDAKTAKDAYMIATGQATAASIKEADVQADLNAKMSSGALSVTAYYQELTKMYQVAQAGTTSLESLAKAQQAADLAAAPAKQKLALIHSQRADRADEATDQATGGDVSGTANITAAANKYKELQAAGMNADANLSKLSYGGDQLKVADNTAAVYSRKLDTLDGRVIRTTVLMTIKTIGSVPGAVNPSGEPQ